MAAKDFFLSRIDKFEKIVSTKKPSASLLMSKALTEKEHNEKVKMLRNGMAIIGFTILEDFIKRRTGEIFKEIGKASVGFNSLPNSIRDASTMSALKGIQNRAKLLKDNSEDYIGFIQTETNYISSTKDSVFEISAYSIGWDKSNLAASDITSFLSVFNVKDGWGAIQSISAITQISLTNPVQIFKNAAARRHKAAHDANADSLLSDLENFVSDSKIISLAFDALLSMSLKHIQDNNSDYLTGKIKTEYSQIKFRFIVEENGKWKEFKDLNKKAFRVNANRTKAVKDATLRAKANDEILIIKAENNQLLNWIIPYAK